MRMTFVHIVVLLSAGLLTLSQSSCLCGGMDVSGRTADGLVEVSVQADFGGSAMTKGTALDGCEASGSGALLVVFDAVDGALVDTWFAPEASISAGGEFTLSLNAARAYDIFLIGNLNYINVTDGSVLDLRRALGAGFPYREDLLEGMEYLFDGGRLGTSVLRREMSSDVVTLGIPYHGVLKGFVPSEAPGGVIPVPCRYFFAKVKITVDHSFYGTETPLSEEWFRDVSLCVCQANACLYPFSSARNRAVADGDVLGRDGEAVASCFDYMTSSVLGDRVEYVLYVPENAQGVLLEENTEASLKTPAGLEEVGKGEKASLCTYFEFSGMLTGVGYSGEVKYRFFLGEDAARDFSVLGGELYDITLSFTPEGFFASSWKASSSVSDRRTLRFFKDAACSDELAAGDDVGIRVGCPLKLYPRVTDGQGNVLPVDAFVGGTLWIPSSGADVALACPFLYAYSSERAALAAVGVSVSVIAGEGCLCFEVADVSLFAAHADEGVLLGIGLMPGDGEPDFVFTLVVEEMDSGWAGSYSFSVCPVYVGYECRIEYFRSGGVGEPCAYDVSVDGEYSGSGTLGTSGVLSVGVLDVGAHLVRLSLAGEELVVLLQEVCAVPDVGVDFGFIWSDTSRYVDVRDADGKAYVAHRLNEGFRWVECHAEGRYDTVSYSFSGICAAVESASGNRMTLSPLSIGRGFIVATFVMGGCECSVEVPYFVYDQVTFRPVEEHGILVLVFNNVKVGWETFMNAGGSFYTADVTWSLALTLVCTDGTRVSGQWGSYSDTGVTVGDGSRHVRDFSDEFRELKNSFTQGHSLTDADRLEGSMTFTVRFVNPYVIAVSTGSTFADFAGMVEASTLTPTAAAQLRHFSQYGNQYLQNNI